MIIIVQLLLSNKIFVNWLITLTVYDLFHDRLNEQNSLIALCYAYYFSDFQQYYIIFVVFIV